jgi:hypothetical protein
LPAGDPFAEDLGALAYFGIASWGIWRSPQGFAEFDIYLDTDRDGSADAVLYNSRAGETDVFISSLISLREDDFLEVIDEQLINNVDGGFDTAKFYSNVMTLPVSLYNLANPTDSFGDPIPPFITAQSSTVNYWIESYDGSYDIVDVIGTPETPMTSNLLNPALTAFVEGSTLPAAVEDGSQLDVTLVNGTSSPQLLLLHHLNSVDDKAQVVTVIAPSNPTPGPTPGPSTPTTPTTPPVTPTTPPAQQPGTGTATINGQAVSPQFASTPGGRGLTVAAGPIRMALAAVTGGQPVPVPGGNTLVLPQSGSMDVGGSGMAPGSSVTFTLYSTPTVLGTVPVKADGTFAGAIAIPSTVPAGNHTLVTSGNVAGGGAASVSMGVLVKSPAAALGASPTVRVPGASAKKPGSSFKVTATGVQARCFATFSVRGDKVKVRASAAGRATATLTAPMRPGRASVQLVVSGKGCDPVAAGATITVSRR